MANSNDQCKTLRELIAQMCTVDKLEIPEPGTTAESEETAKTVKVSADTKSIISRAQGVMQIQREATLTINDVVWIACRSFLDTPSNTMDVSEILDTVETGDKVIRLSDETRSCLRRAEGYVQFITGEDVVAGQAVHLVIEAYLDPVQDLT